MIVQGIDNEALKHSLIAPAIPHNTAQGYKRHRTGQETGHQMLPGVNFHSCD